MRNSPRITTIVPTYRRPGLLAKALESVSEQTFADYQVRVYDNASGDDTAEVVRRYAADDPRIQYYVHPENIGAEQNFRFGLEHVDTEYFSFLSDDDLLLPRLYELTVAALDENPDAAMASTRVIHANAQGHLALEPTLEPGVHQPPEGLVAMLNLAQPTWTGTLFRQAATERVGTIDELTVIDLDLELRIASQLPFVVLREPGAVLMTDNHFGKCLQWSERWERTVEKIAGDKSLPLEVRRMARTSLDRRLKDMVFQTGVVATRMERPDVAGEAAKLLATRYRDQRAAFLVTASARVTPVLAPPYKAIRGAARKLMRGRRDSASDRLHRELRATAPKVADLL